MWKKPVEQRVKLFKEYYSMENKQPLLGFFHGSEYPIHRYPASQTLPEGKALIPTDFTVEPYLKDCENLFSLHEQCGGDFIWSGTSFWGIPWLEAALGCEIIGDQKTGSLHANPPKNFKGVGN